MKKVVKLVVIDDRNKYLLLTRSDHPTFPSDADIPGGGVEDGELVLDALVREVDEEVGFKVDKEKLSEIYSGSEYSKHDTNYSLYITQLTARPQVSISWEHSSCEWLDKDVFLEKAKNAKDTFMHMVYEVISSEA